MIFLQILSIILLYIFNKFDSYKILKVNRYRVAKIYSNVVLFNSIKGLNIDVISNTKANVSVGIDLGTTYSLISVIDHKNYSISNAYPRIIPIDSQRMLPSVVSYGGGEGAIILVGSDAINQEYKNAMNTFSSIKRIIGKTYKEVKEEKEKPLDLKIAYSKSNPSSVCELFVPSLNRKISPEAVSSEILKKLIHSARDYLGDSVNIDKAVITVPAYFSDAQRSATERAGIMAGLDKVKLLKEPEAAALAYGILQKQQQMVLVFDLGGGTFDVSVLEVGGGFVEVIATAGDGGDDFDNVIIDWMISQFSKISIEGSNLLKKDVNSMRKLKAEAVRVKLQLSQFPVASVQVNDLYEGLSLNETLSRKQFESLSKQLFDRLLKPLREVSLMAGINLPGESGQIGIFQSEIDMMDQIGDVDEVDQMTSQRNLQMAGRASAKEKNKAKGNSKRELRRLQKEYSDPSLSLFPGGQALDDVILVGGATRMPSIVRLVKIMTGIDPRRSVNPDEAVCLGAGIWAGILDGKIENMQVMSAWQAAMFRAFYDAKQKGNRLSFDEDGDDLLKTNDFDSNSDKFSINKDSNNINNKVTEEDENSVNASKKKSLLNKIRQAKRKK